MLLSEYFASVFSLLYPWFLSSFLTFLIPHSPGSLISDHLSQVVPPPCKLPAHFLTIFCNQCIPSALIILCNSTIRTIIYTLVTLKYIYISNPEISWELQIHLSNYLRDISITQISQTQYIYIELFPSQLPPNLLLLYFQ